MELAPAAAAAEVGLEDGGWGVEAAAKRRHSACAVASAPATSLLRCASCARSRSVSAGPLPALSVGRRDTASCSAPAWASKAASAGS